MTFGSLFSGIGGFDRGFEQAGMECLWQCEIEPNARKVLRKHWPDAPLHNDVKNIGVHNLARVDVICGGFPCQDVSVAGKRAGLDGARSGLWFEFRRIVAELTPRTVVIENVPGLLSGCGCLDCQAVGRIIRIHRYLRGKRKIHQPCALCVAGERMLASHSGRNLAIVLRGLAELGYNVAWASLDAQFYGLAQRRKRVFIIGSFGDHRCAEILFESESLRWDTEPSRTKGQRVARSLTRGTSSPGVNPPGRRKEDDDNIVIAKTLKANGHLSWDESQDTLITNGIATNESPVAGTLGAHKTGGWGGSDLDTNGALISVGYCPDLAPFGTARDAKGERQDINEPSLIAIPLQEPERALVRGQNGSGIGSVGDPMFSLQAGTEHGVCYELTHADEVIRESGDIAPTLQRRMGTGGNQVPMIGVRRLTPIECARLQGFEDDHCAGLSDSAQYRAYGNAVAVLVARWIGKQIMAHT